MTIATLIPNTRDNDEVVRDKIAEILLLETASQQALAPADDEDPEDYRFRVFVERSNPFEEWLQNAADDEADTVDAAPIIHIGYDSSTFDKKASDTIKRQKATGIYQIDIYGYGKSQDVFAGGHVSGDRVAAFEAQRAKRLIRRILMSADYMYLGLRGTVWSRWIDSITKFQPSVGDQTVQHVSAVRLSLAVEFNEFSPQMPEETLEYVAVTVKRKETGEVYLVAGYDYTP